MTFSNSVQEQYHTAVQVDLSSEKVFDDDNDGSNTFTAGHGDKTALSNKVTSGGQKKKKPGNSNQVGNTWR